MKWKSIFYFQCNNCSKYFKCDDYTCSHSDENCLCDYCYGEECCHSKRLTTKEIIAYKL
jgi:hypothetical protein